MRRHLRANPQLRVLLNATPIPAREPVPSTVRAASTEWRNCLHAPGGKSRTSPPSACACRILLRTHSLSLSIAETAGGRICDRSSLLIVPQEKSSGGKPSLAITADGSCERGPASLIPGRLEGCWGRQSLSWHLQAPLCWYLPGSRWVRRFLAWKGRRVKVLATAGSEAPSF